MLSRPARLTGSLKPASDFSQYQKKAMALGYDQSPAKLVVQAEPKGYPGAPMTDPAQFQT